MLKSHGNRRTMDILHKAIDKKYTGESLNVACVPKKGTVESQRNV